MTLKAIGLIASIGAALLVLAPEDSLAQGKGGPMSVPFVRPGVPIGPKPIAPHFKRGAIGGWWPAGSTGFWYGPPYNGTPLDASPAPGLNDMDVNVKYTYKQDVPWDWAHRFPPAVALSDRPYVPGCSSEPVTVPGRSGEQTVNVIRCY